MLSLLKSLPSRPVLAVSKLSRKSLTFQTALASPLKAMITINANKISKKLTDRYLHAHLFKISCTTLHTHAQKVENNRITAETIFEVLFN